MNLQGRCCAVALCLFSLLEHSLLVSANTNADHYKSSPSRPYVCSVKDVSGKHVCACTVLSSGLVLTAAHCLDFSHTIRMQSYVKSGSVKVNAVSSYRCRHQVVLPSYQPITRENDVGLCVLNGTAQVEAYPQLPSEQLAIPLRTPLSVYGWRHDADLASGGFEPAVRIAQVISEPQDACRSERSFMSSMMICGQRDETGDAACGGDVGGPLVKLGPSADQDLLVGLVVHDKYCTGPNMFMDIRKLLGWFDQIEEAFITMSNATVWSSLPMEAGGDKELLA